MNELETIPSTYTDADGWIIDSSGEVVGHAEATERFRIDSIEAADWALEKRTEIESAILAIRARKRAVVAQLEALEQHQLRRLSWWDYRFSSDLAAFARTLLKGKSRTAQFGWGRVSFRATKGRTEILAPDEALEYVKIYAPEKVKVRESVDVAAVLTAMERARDAGDEDKPNWLHQTGPDENVTITTGIELENTR